ncbi:Ras-like protein [Paramicrosporidium saccamoebae]|uniref:Ras-like protein n=1 Tax=Paramicrosporidium saccamoebae TaxID=1246581 RepID=A0A2H9TQB2_9FUNG|nr:Ras-like protein [Paramicrosporidium saccamoebae]
MHVLWMNTTLPSKCTVDEETAILDILDTAGQEDYSYLRRGDGFLLVFALNSKSSFQEVQKFQEQILRVKDADAFPMILVGNKSDLSAERQISAAEAKELARSFGCRYIETSAKARHNVEESFYGLVKEIQKSRQEQAAGEKKNAPNRKSTGCTTM